MYTAGRPGRAQGNGAGTAGTEAGTPGRRPATPGDDPAAAAGSRPHIIAFDLIRLLIIAFVVGVHILAVGGGTITPALGAFVTVFHTSRELFFLITMVVLTYNYGRRPRMHWPRFWRRRYGLVVPAYVAWSLIYFLADGERLDPVSAAARRFARDLLTADARYQLYFLLVTMQVYLAFPLVRWLLRATRGRHLILLAVACGYQLALTVAIQHHLVRTGLVGSWLNDPGPWLPSYVFYILGGGVVGWHFERLSDFTRRHATKATAAAVAGTGVLAGTGAYALGVYAGGQAPSAASAVFQPVVVVETIAFGWSLLAIGLMWADRGARWRRQISDGADSSFGIYLVHPLVLQGAVLLAGAAGILNPVRRTLDPVPHSHAVVELTVLLGVALPLIYSVSWGITFVLRRTPLSLMLTGRRRARRPRRSRRQRLALAAAFFAAAGLVTAACAGITGAGRTGAGRRSSPVTTTGSLRVGARTRTWEQIAPATPLAASAPIIVVLSGISATVRQEIARDDLKPYVTANRAELVYPVGVDESWNAGGCCGKAAAMKVEDVAFMKALVARVDPGRAHPIDLVGYSNGGRLTYRVACTDPGLFDQMAVIKAMPMPGCVVTRPVSLLQIDATNDPAVPYLPGDKGRETPAATTEVRRLRSADDCPASSSAVLTRGALRLTSWSGCSDGKILGFAVYRGGGHSFPQAAGKTPAAATVIWSFFSNQ